MHGGNDYDTMEEDYEVAGMDTSFADNTAPSLNQSGFNTSRQNFGAGNPLVPVTVADLKECDLRGPHDGAHFSIAGTAFERLKLVAKVVRAVQHEGYHLYEVADPSRPSDIEEETFILIDNRDPEAQPLAAGTVLTAVGKLQPYNERQCMLAFHLAPVKEGENGGKEAELHGLECQVARKYYEKAICEHSALELRGAGYGDTLFSPDPPAPRAQRQQGGGTPGRTPLTPSSRQQEGGTPGRTPLTPSSRQAQRAGWLNE